MTFSMRKIAAGALALLVIAGCGSTRMLLPEQLPDTVGVHVQYIGGLTSSYRDELTPSLKRMIRRHNQEAGTKLLLQSRLDSSDVFVVEVMRVHVSGRGKQAAFLAVDMFGLFVMPNIMKSLGSDLTGRFLLLPWDRVHYSIRYLDNDGNSSDVIVRIAGRVPYFENPERQLHQVSKAFSENLLEFIQSKLDP